MTYESYSGRQPGAPRVVQLSSLGGLDRHARIHDEALVSAFADLGLTPDTGT